MGGLRKDVDDKTLVEIVNILKGIKKDIKDLTDVFLEDDSVKNRMCGVGVLSKEDAEGALRRRSCGKRLRSDSGHASDR